MFKSERTSAYEFASAEETRIFERQSVFSRTLSANKAAEVLSENGEFLWRKLIFVASLFSAFVSLTFPAGSSSFCRYANGFIEKL